jgi:hypothetical protein
MDRRIGWFLGCLGVAGALGVGAFFYSGFSPARTEPGNATAGPGLAADAPVVLMSPTPARLQAEALAAKQPLYFIENRGQADPRVKFYQRGAGETILFTPEGVCFSLWRGAPPVGISGSPGQPGLERFLAEKNQAPAKNQPPPALVQLTPVGMQPNVEITPADPQEAKFNYFLGNDPEKWRSNIPSYGAVVYREAYPGIDLKFYGAARQLEYDIIVRPGADPDLVKFRYAGIKGLKITATGDLAIMLPDGGELVQKKPVVYQEVAGVRVAREGKFRVGPETAGHVYGFEVAAYDKHAPLVIDPVLVYSTYLGGAGIDQGLAIALDGNGCACVTGKTNSPNLGTAGAYQFSLQGDSDAFVAKFNAAGSGLVFFTYLGGSAEDAGLGIAVGGDGSISVTGYTHSANFPLYHALPAFGTQNQKLGPNTAFVSQLNASGNMLSYSTFLGGSNRDSGNAIAVDGAGNAYIAGDTTSTDFPLSANPYQAALKGYRNAWVTKLSPAISHIGPPPDYQISFYPNILISTYLGGDQQDWAAAIALGSTGKFYIAGATDSPEFPTLLPYSTHNGSYDAFVACFETTGALFFSTCLGGADLDQAFGLAVDQPGNIYVVGSTESGDFPLKTPFQGSRHGLQDAFVTKLYPPFSATIGGVTFWVPVGLTYSTYLGGDNYENGHGIAVDPAGCAYVVGETNSPTFPTRNPCQPHIQGAYDAFVTKLAADGKSLVYSTFLGGSNDDGALGIARNGAGQAYVVGYCNGGFPTRNPFQPTYGGNEDGFVAKLTDSSLPPLMLLLSD